MQAIKTTKKAPGLRLDALPPDVARRLPLLIGGGVVALAMLFFMLDQPQGATSKSTASRSTVRVAAPAPAPAPRSMKDYSSLMGRNLFKPLVSDQARRNAASGAAGANLPPGMTPLPPLTVEGFGDTVSAKAKALTTAWSYIGSVTIDNVSYALLQQSSGGDYGYYRVGEQVGGASIRAIQPESLVLASAGETVRLPKTSGAPAPTARPSAPTAQAAPGAPGGENANTAPQANTQDNAVPGQNFGNGGNFRGGGRRGFRGFGGNGGGNFQGFRRRGNNGNRGGNFNNGNPNNGGNGDNGNNNGNDNQG